MKEAQTMTVQLSTRIDVKVKRILSELHRKTHVPIRVLTERAIFLLKERYDGMNKIHKQGTADERFMELLNYSLKTHDTTYRELADK
ncbi:MAG: hypothetical protein AB1629_07460 [Candidatus Omnitrophota bacterium]